MAETARFLVAASFTTPDGGGRAAGAIAGAFPDRVGNTAVLTVDAAGKPKFVESKDWGAGRGALLGGAIGIIGGPLGMLAGGGIGALAAKLRDSGFKDGDLETLGRSLGPGHSAAVVEIAAGSAKTATALATALGAEKVVTEPIDAQITELFAGDDAPEPDAEQ